MAVIGADVVQRFFLNEDPIGKLITVDGNSFEVVGTIAKRKSFPGDNGSDRVVKIPFLTFRKLYPQQKEGVFILAMAYEGKLNQAWDEVRMVLRRRRHVKPLDKDNFGISSAEALINHADREREAELAALWRRLPNLEPETRDAIDGMTRHLASRLLREPLERLGRDSDGRDERAVRDIFSL